MLWSGVDAEEWSGCCGVDAEEWVLRSGCCGVEWVLWSGVDPLDIFNHSSIWDFLHY